MSQTPYSPLRLLSVSLIALCVTAAPCLAVQSYTPSIPDPAVESWRWRSYRELTGAGLRCMAESADRTLWFGVDEGVWSYDGFGWKRFAGDGLVPGPINALLAAADGSIYAGSDRGISRYREGRWSREFPSEEIPWPIDAFLQAHDGRIWAATGWGLLLVSSEQRLFTIEEMAAALSRWDASVAMEVVPVSAVPEVPWGEGSGIAVIKGSYLGFWRGEVPMAIWEVAPDSPGAAAGIRVGDVIHAIDDALPNLPYFILGGTAGISAVLRVQRRDESEPVDTRVTLAEVAGTVKRFSLSDVVEDARGRLWLGVSWSGDVVRFDPQAATDAWQLMTPNSELGLHARPQLCAAGERIWRVANQSDAAIAWYDGEAWREAEGAPGRTSINTAILETADGTVWIGGHGGELRAYRHGQWRTYKTSEVPLPGVRLIDLLETRDGALWIAGLGRDAVRLDHREDLWLTRAGLTYHCEASGSDWFTTLGQNQRFVVEHDGERWFQYGTEDGLMRWPRRVVEGSDGALWVAGRHDGRAATAVLAPTGQLTNRRWTLRMHNHFAPEIDRNSVFVANDSSIWFGAYGLGPGDTGGILRYDGEQWRTFPSSESLLGPYAIAQTPEAVWFGGSLRRYDGSSWSEITEPRGVASWVHDLTGTPDGDLWVATRTYGAYRYDGEVWHRYGVGDGLADDHVDAIVRATDGTVWAATAKGYSRFDGRSWVTHALREALKSQGMRGGMEEGAAGSIWINLDQATIRYRPDREPPETNISLFLAEVSQPGNTTMAWSGTDPWQVTRDDELHFSYRLDEGAWSAFAPARSQVFLSLASGAHTFRVKARDRDLNEDPTPAEVSFQVVAPVWRRPWFVGLMTCLLGAVALQTARIVRRDRQERRELELELQTAHDLQMGLMPSSPPRVQGFDIAGRCQPATQVGGDFFQFSPLSRDCLAVAMADVTGHSMEAAIPLVMFAGILESQLELSGLLASDDATADTDRSRGGRLEELFDRLNRAIHRTLPERTFVCFIMGELNTNKRSIRIANSGCPYPFRYHAATSTITDLSASGYPLGISTSTQYECVEADLDRGDRVVFCSDGIIETQNAAGDVFGFERAAAAIQAACEADMEASDILHRVIDAAEQFAAGRPQSDDQTIVVLRVV